MGLLDISSFFTGLIINLLLISLICYYFKRKYENLEESINEHAKIIYELMENRKKELIVDEIIQDDEIVQDDDTDTSSDTSVSTMNSAIKSSDEFNDTIDVVENNNVIVENISNNEVIVENSNDSELQAIHEYNTPETQDKNIELDEEVNDQIIEVNKIEVDDDDKVDDKVIEADDNGYNKKNKEELREILTNKNIEFSMKMKKNELLRLLYKRDTLVVNIS